MPSAASAASAGDAETVDGMHAAELATTSAFAERTASLSLTTMDQTVVSTNITTTGTRLIALASIAMEEGGAGADIAYCKLSVAGVDSQEYADETHVEGAMSITQAQVVGPGTHGVSLRCSESGAVTVTDAALSVWAVGS